ncbi:MAG: S8 family serine peptidase, partial [Ignavibacteria bacterium]|nr:S8 family serine peptidase [Ignavibacteria bacterium]
MKKILVLISILLVTNNVISSSKIGKSLSKIVTNENSSNNYKVIIYLKDKGPHQNLLLQNPLGLVSQRSLERRAKVFPKGQLVSYEDLPIYEGYYNSIKLIVKRLRHTLKWINAISAEVELNQIDKLVELPFVKEIELLDCYKNSYVDDKQNSILTKDVQPNGVYSLNYGSSFTQNNQINVPAVHNLGNYGQGIVICVMDAGFNRLTHEAFQQMQIIATYDFVNNRPYVGDGQGGQGSGSHGTQTLSTIGGFKDGKLIGPAFGSKYILAKTENTESETPIEMDNWARALEWADSIGVDVTSTSLG